MKGNAMNVEYVEIRNRAGRQTGFTLIELLLVMIILAILAAVVVPKFVGRSEQAKESAAKTDLANLSLCLDTFEKDNDRFPTTQEGLQALVERPASMDTWKGPYVDAVPNDPWKHPYIYRFPGTGSKAYDLLSAGPDGSEGTADDITK